MAAPAAFKEAKKAADEQTVKNFLKWLNGQGSDYDIRKTPWGRTKVAYEIPEVREYIGSFIDLMMDVQVRLVKLIMKAPKTLNEYWIYWKYVIHVDEWPEADPFYFTFIHRDFFHGQLPDDGGAGLLFPHGPPLNRPGPQIDRPRQLPPPAFPPGGGWDPFNPADDDENRGDPRRRPHLASEPIEGEEIDAGIQVVNTELQLAYWNRELPLFLQNSAELVEVVREIGTRQRNLDEDFMLHYRCDIVGIQLSIS